MEHIKESAEIGDNDIQLMVFMGDEQYPFTKNIKSSMGKLLTSLNEKADKHLVFVLFRAHCFDIYYADNEIDELTEFIDNLFVFNGLPS